MQRPPHRFTSNSAATSPRTNPLRSNNNRDRDDPAYSLEKTMSSGTGRSSDDVSSGAGSEEVSQTLDEKMAEEQKGRQRLNNIIQQFYIKGALVIVGARHTLRPWVKNNVVKQNKWFNVVLNDSEELLEPLSHWRSLDVLDDRPSPMVIEVYLDLNDLTPSQTLVILDKDGQRWDVAESLNRLVGYNSRPSATSRKEIVLERWRVELGQASAAVPSEAWYDLPNAYKKAVVLFRSLFTHTRILPTWKYFRRIAKNPPHSPALKLKYRISNGDIAPNTRDTLDLSLVPEPGSVTSRYVFEPSLSPVGPFCISVEYRENCDFRVDDSESLLSSHFMASDDKYFRPSLSPQRGSRNDKDHVPGSLPTRRNFVEEQADQGHAYGSMSTFHAVGQPSTSPISAIRNAHWPGVDPSPSTSPPQKLPPNHRMAQGSKSSLRSVEGGALPYQRRTSVSFQPFKAGSLASSPASGAMHMPVPPSPSSSSLGRDRPSSLSPLAQGATGTSLPAQHARNRNSLTTLPQQALRAPVNIPNETAIASSASSSPKPAPISRYSSSFSNRRNRFSSASAGTGTGGSNSRTEDGDPSGGNNSSGKGSVSSSTRADTSTPDVVSGGAGAGGGSSGSVQADDDNLKDFIKLLEQKKELKSFNRTDERVKEANITRTTAQLSKYQRMRDSNAALSDSLSSSLLLHRSSSSSSRQLSAVPPMIADRGGSFESSSPGKPISPHTPHTPAIPSRLSAGSVIDYSDVRRSRSGARSAPRSSGRDRADLGVETDMDTAVPGASGMERTGSNAIPIPTSPRAWPYVRRSSSVAQQQRQQAIDDPDVDLYGMRSASLPNDDSQGISMSELVRMTQEPGNVIPAAGALLETGSAADSGDDPAVALAPYATGDATADTLSYRPRTSGDRYSQRGRWRIPPSHTAGSSASSSTAHPASAPGPGSMSSTSRGSRNSFGSRGAAVTRDRDEDDEPLLFTMSELGAQSRKSLEDARGGSSSSGTGRARGGSGWQ
ncbi:hypothetical protein NA57DRAFT_40756 [Rhizodiscina lignyota]|uniref:Autophagy-related protein 13 n=1 Tax=Rhizodiscina lignyota TaxID=1504668 RepID=A0A9P4IB23_9PEZI|nr:hypothetical protein NA57DRAFT_40756 [Rhizodiscina lignyota]